MFSSVELNRGMSIPILPASSEQIQKRIESLQQENGVLKMELGTFRMEVKNLQNENKALRQANVNIYAMAEQEEEFMYNILLKQIQTLKKEKETLALNYEWECRINDSFRKLNQHAEAVQEEGFKYNFLREQECVINDLLSKLNEAEEEEELKNDILRKQECVINNLLRKLNQQAKAEQEEEFISSLLKQIKTLKIEKEILPLRYEQERKLKRSRKLNQLRREMHTLDEEQEALVNRPMRKIEKVLQFFRNIGKKYSKNKE